MLDYPISRSTENKNRNVETIRKSKLQTVIYSRNFKGKASSILRSLIDYDWIQESRNACWTCWCSHLFRDFSTDYYRWSSLVNFMNQLIHWSGVGRFVYTLVKSISNMPIYCWDLDSAWSIGCSGSRWIVVRSCLLEVL